MTEVTNYHGAKLEFPCSALVCTVSKKKKSIITKKPVNEVPILILHCPLSVRSYIRYTTSMRRSHQWRCATHLARRGYDANRFGSESFSSVICEYSWGLIWTAAMFGHVVTRAYYKPYYYLPAWPGLMSRNRREIGLSWDHLWGDFVSARYPRTSTTTIRPNV